MIHFRQKLSNNPILKKSAKFVGAALLAMSATLGHSAKADVLDDSSFGYRWESLYLVNTHSGFFGYKPIPFLGIKIGVGYGSDFLICIPTSIDIFDLPKTASDFTKSLQGMEQGIVDKRLIDDLQTILDGVSADPTDAVIDARVDQATTKIKALRAGAITALDDILKDRLDAGWGAYSVRFLSIPLKFQIFPFGGSFAINLGLKLDYLVSVKEVSVSNLATKAKDIVNEFISDEYVDKKSTEYKRDFKAVKQQNPQNIIASLQRLERKLTEDVKLKATDVENKVKDEINELEKNFKVESFSDALEIPEKIEKKDEVGDSDLEARFNKTRWSGVFGFEHTFFFGLLIGIEGTWYFNSFVKYDESKSKMLLPAMVHLSIGLDIAKVSDLCMA